MLLRPQRERDGRLSPSRQQVGLVAVGGVDSSTICGGGHAAFTRGFREHGGLVQPESVSVTPDLERHGPASRRASSSPSTSPMPMPLADGIPGACADTTRATSAIVGAPESSIDSFCSDSISWIAVRAERTPGAPLLAEAEEAGDTGDDDGDREREPPAGHLVVVAEGDLSARLHDQHQRCSPAEGQARTDGPNPPYQTVNATAAMSSE